MSAGDPTSLEEMVRKVRAHLRRLGAAVVLLAAVGVLALVLISAWFLVGGGGWRPGSPVPVMLAILVLLGVASVVGAAFRFLRRWSEEATLAREMERNAGLSPGALRAQLELGRGIPEGVSGVLVASGAQKLRGLLEARPSELAREPAGRLVAGIRGTALAAGLLGGVVVLLFALSPERSQTAWAGLVHPVGVLSGSGLGPLTLSPGDTALPRGTIPRIEIGAPRRQEVTLYWQATGEPLSRRTLQVEEGSASADLPPIQASLRYWASAPDGARSAEARIEPSDPLLLTNLAVELRFPAYTGLPHEVIRGSPGELRLLQGTRVVFRGSVGGAGASALLLRDENGALEIRMPVEDGHFEVEWRPTRSGELTWEGEEIAGDHALPGPIRLTLEPDLPPRVALPVPGSDGDLPTSFRMPLLLEASDDYGLARVELEVVRVRSDGSREAPVAESIPVDGRREVTMRPVLELQDWGLGPGEEILLRARAVDVSPAEQGALTPEYRFRVPAPAAQREAARQAVERAGERVGELARRADREAEEFRRMGQDARVADASGEESAGFQGREELRRAVEAHESMADELDALRQELERTREALEGLGNEDGGLRERLRELEALVAELADPEQRARMEELLAQLSEGVSPDAKAELEAMAEGREALRERLEAAMERLQREALEQAFLGSEEELRDITQAQEDMAERLAAGEDGGVQEALAERVAELEDRLDELVARLQESGEQGAAERTGEVAGEVEQARDAMEAAAEAARAGDATGASEEADQAAREARQALQEMEQVRMEWLEQWEEQVRDALRLGAQDALSLARMQAEIRERIRGAAALERARLQDEEAAVVQGIRSLAARLSLATRQAASVGRDVVSALGEALEEGERTMQGLERPSRLPGGAQATAGRVVDALNRAALAALAGMDRVGETPAGSAMDDLLAELEELAGQQEAINQESDAVAGEQDGDGAAARMEDLASAQEAVAGGVEELAQQPGGEWTPGDLQDMAREARELARELAEGRLEPEVRQRQEDLLERFLGAGRMLERDGPTEERRGTTAGPVERGLVAPLSPDLTDGSRIPLPSAGELEGLSPAERRLVLEYFERLNREQGGGGGDR